MTPDDLNTFVYTQTGCCPGSNISILACDYIQYTSNKPFAGSTEQKRKFKSMKSFQMIHGNKIMFLCFGKTNPRMQYDFFPGDTSRKCNIYAFLQIIFHIFY